MTGPCGRGEVDAVLFDWGKTLISGFVDEDVLCGATEAGLATVRSRKTPPVAAILDYWRGVEGRLPHDLEDEIDLLEETITCFTELGYPLTPRGAAAYLRASELYICGRQEVHPEAHDLLDALRALGFKLALVSNVRTPKSVLDDVMEEEGLAPRVDATIYSCVVGKRKPHPAIFLTALTTLGARPGAAIFVGDRSFHDVAGAKRVGMTTIQAVWYRDDRNADESPDYVATAPLEVLDIIRELT